MYPATKEGKFIGAAVEATSMGFGGELKVLVPAEIRIGRAEGGYYPRLYSLLSHVETPGLGSKAADCRFKRRRPNKGDIKGEPN